MMLVTFSIFSTVFRKQFWIVIRQGWEHRKESGLENWLGRYTSRGSCLDLPLLHCNDSSLSGLPYYIIVLNEITEVGNGGVELYSEHVIREDFYSLKGKQ